MNGSSVFRFAVARCRRWSPMLTHAGRTLEDLALLIPHQANGRIIDAATQKLSSRKAHGEY